MKNWKFQKQNHHETRFKLNTEFVAIFELSPQSTERSPQSMWAEPTVHRPSSTIHVNNKDDRMSHGSPRPPRGLRVMNEMKDFKIDNVVCKLLS